MADEPLPATIQEEKAKQRRRTTSIHVNPPAVARLPEEHEQQAIAALAVMIETWWNNQPENRNS